MPGKKNLTKMAASNRRPRGAGKKVRQSRNREQDRRGFSSTRGDAKEKKTSPSFPKNQKVLESPAEKNQIRETVRENEKVGGKFTGGPTGGWKMGRKREDQMKKIKGPKTQEIKRSYVAVREAKQRGESS